MSDQIDIFGGTVTHPAPPVKNAPPSPAYDFPTCWGDCELCGQQMHSQRSSNPKHRLFIFCGHPDKETERCFEDSAICSKVLRKPRPQVIKPAAQGWLDY